jgi:hypothetical protein
MNVKNQDHPEGKKRFTQKRADQSYVWIPLIIFPFKIFHIPGHTMVFDPIGSGFSQILNPSHDAINQVIPKVQIGLKLSC